MLAEMKNHVHTEDAEYDIPAGATVDAEYVGTARHPWLRVPMVCYRVTFNGRDRGVFWERDLHLINHGA